MRGRKKVILVCVWGRLWRQWRRRKEKGRKDVGVGRRGNEEGEGTKGVVGGIREGGGGGGGCACVRGLIMGGDAE